MNLRQGACYGAFQVGLLSSSLLAGLGFAELRLAGVSWGMPLPEEISGEISGAASAPLDSLPVNSEHLTSGSTGDIAGDIAGDLTNDITSVAQPDVTASTQAADLLKPPTDTAVAQVQPEIERQQDAQDTEELRVPTGQGETIAEIELRYVDRDGQPIEGKTRPEIITRNFDLQPGDRYDPVLAEADLARVVALTAIQDASIQLEPAADPAQVVMVYQLREASTITFYPGNEVALPSVLRGITLPPPVRTVPLRLNGIQLPGSVQLRNIGGIDQSLTLGVLLGDQADGFDLTFANPWILGTDHFSHALNFQGIGYLNPTFNAGDEVELPTGNTDFWERRVGGGIQIVQNPTPELGWAAGLSYEQISMREALTGSRLFTRDREGNRLVLSDDGIDSLLTINATLNYDSRNDVGFPTAGNRVQLGLDQSIPIGDASILYTRPTANFVQYLPLSFITVDGTPSTLLLNLQGGTLLGDTPPYEAFVLGGSSSVRGFGTGELGSPQTYLQASLEYRAPFAALRIEPVLLQEALGDRVLFAANAFVDYGTGFGTQTFITGEPGVVRDKPGSGFGFGLGLLATSNVGLMRLEAGISDRGDFSAYFTIGDRF